MYGFDGQVLSLLGGERTSGGVVHLGEPEKAETTTFQMPDLIDTGDANDLCGTEYSVKMQSDQSNVNPTSSSTIPSIDDLFGDSLHNGVSTSEQKNDDDPFADVSFHNNNGTEHVADLFSGMTIDKPGATGVHIAADKNGPEILDIFGSSSEFPQQNGNFAGTFSENIFSDSTANLSPQVSNGVLNDMACSQSVGMNANPMFPLGPMAYNLPSGFMFSPAFSSQPMNYNVMGSLLAQQQFLATTSNFQLLGSLHSQSAGVNHAALNKGGEYSSALPDIFNPSVTTQTPASMMNSSRKEETKAFDFISVSLELLTVLN
ncbi:unnamed protein product [Ilex paraguariensis]|uniref:Uncharacterized protein n=1 Tax=Ilex paraguariensis TaxID=185542 RepID=A0ABC8R9Q8_9AQUA